MRKPSWKIVILIILIVLVCASTTIYFQFLQPSKLGKTISLFLGEEMAKSYKADTVEVSFFPSPSINVKGCTYSNNDLSIEFSAKEFQVDMSWEFLFSGDFKITSILLDTPYLKHIKQKNDAEAKQNDINKNLAQEQSDSSSSESSLEEMGTELVESHVMDLALKFFDTVEELKTIEGSEVTLRKGELHVFFEESQQNIVLTGIDFDGSLPYFLSGLLDLRIANVEISSPNTSNIYLTNTAFLLKDWLLKDKDINSNLFIQTNIQMDEILKNGKPVQKEYRYFPMPEPAHFNLKSVINIDKVAKNFDVEGTLRLNATLPMNTHNTDLEIELPFFFASSVQKESVLEIPKETKENKKHLQAFLKENPKLAKSAIEFKDIYVDAIKIEAGKIKIGDDGLTFTGNILGLYPFNFLAQGNADLHRFSLPRWIGPVRPMSGGLHNALNNIHGRLEFMSTLKGVFAKKIEAQVLNIKTLGVGSCANYLQPDIAIDIVVQEDAGRKNYADLNVIFPEILRRNVEKDSLPPPAVVHSNSKNKADQLFVDYHIGVKAKNVDVWKVSVSDVECMISPDKYENPTIESKINSIYEGQGYALTILKDSGTYITASAKGVKLSGLTKAIAGYEFASGVFSTDSEVFFDGDSLETVLNTLYVKGKAQAESVAIRTETEVLEHFSRVDAVFDAKSIEFLDKNKGTLPSFFAMQGVWDIRLHNNKYFAKLSRKGKLEFSTESGVPERLPVEATRLELDFLYKEGKKAIIKGIGNLGYDFPKKEYFILKNFIGKFDKSNISSSIIAKNKMLVTGEYIMDWQGSLVFDAINIDNYFAGKEKNKHEDKKFDFSFLRENNIDFKVKSDVLSIFKTTIDDATLNIKVKDKSIRIFDNTAKIRGGGTIQAILEGLIIEDSLSYTAKIQSLNVNTEAVSRMRRQDFLLGGTGFLKMEIQGLASSMKEIYSRLNGKWSILIQNGFFVNFDTKKENINKKVKSKTPTKFDSIVASGTIKNGLFTNDNFNITANAFKVKGEGTFNLPTEEVDAHAVITILGIPEIPINITGKIDNLEFDTKLLTAVTGTLGNISLGVFNIMEAILINPFKSLVQ